MLRRLIHGCVGLAVLTVLILPGSGGATAVAQADMLSPVAPPVEAEGLGAGWYTVTDADGRTLLLAVYDPRTSPDQVMPAILVLHGTHGFALEYVQLAQALSAQTGYVVAAGCWFDGVGLDADTSAITPIRCPGGPQFSGATPAAWPTVRTLSEAVLRHAGTDQLGIFGHSRGAEVALQIASSPDPVGFNVQAVTASSGIYTAMPAAATYDSPAPLSMAASLSAPVLILHGQADAEAHIAQATLYYDRLRSLNKPAQCTIYPRVGHDALVETAAGGVESGRIFTDSVQRSAAFFQSVFSPFASVQALDCLPG